MSASLRHLRPLAGLLLLGTVLLGGCTANTPSVDSPAVAPPTVPSLPSRYHTEEMVGRWGYGAYHNDTDLARTAAAARGQCGQAVDIKRGPNGGLMMYLADSAELQELVLKGSSDGKDYVGPPGDAGGAQDRQIVSFDGRTLVLRWMDPEVAGRYGTGVYVRCAPEGAAPRAAGRPPMKPVSQQ
jgi:hypothetical protein